MNVVVEKIFDPKVFLFYWQSSDVVEVKSNLKVGGAKHILSNISKIMFNENLEDKKRNEQYNNFLSHCSLEYILSNAFFIVYYFLISFRINSISIQSAK